MTVQQAITLQPGDKTALPRIHRRNAMPLEEALLMRRSSREFASEPLKKEELGQLLWAAQGVSGAGGLRTAPSPNAIYPLRTYVLAAHVEDLPPGLYSYDNDREELRFMTRGDRRTRLCVAAMGQVCTLACGAAVLLAADLRGMTREFGDSGAMLARMEAGHAGQNFLLQAASLGLGAIGLCKMMTPLMKSVFQLPPKEEPYYLLLAGKTAD